MTRRVLRKFRWFGFALSCGVTSGACALLAGCGGAEHEHATGQRYGVELVPFFGGMAGIGLAVTDHRESKYHLYMNSGGEESPEGGPEEFVLVMTVDMNDFGAMDLVPEFVRPDPGEGSDTP